MPRFLTMMYKTKSVPYFAFTVRFLLVVTFVRFRCNFSEGYINFDQQFEMHLRDVFYRSYKVYSF